MEKDPGDTGKPSGEKSFLADLLAKQSYVKGVPGDHSAAEAEVQRQIDQATQGGDPITGEDVTKSGGDD